jgi:hypothetical protein
MELMEGGKGNEMKSINNVVKHNVCESREYNDMY